MHHSPLDALERTNDFIRRHVGPGEKQIESMLETIGVADLDELIDKTVPEAIRIKQPLDLPSNISERYSLSVLRKMSSRNQVFISMIGMGYYGVVMPNVILRNVLENPGWYTAYTPYQAEVSQGRLEAVLNYQQVIIDMTGMSLANASMLDEATAAAEAMSMSHRISKKRGCDTFFVDKNCHPQTITVMQTRAKLAEFTIVIGDPWSELGDHDVFGVMIQYPGSTGEIRDPESIISAAHETKAIACVATDLMALAILKPPGEMDADIVIGSAQRFGVPMGYGGPHAAFFATKEKYTRQIPGRIIGVSKDSQGKQALRMALQTREQHIRREKATSNICTAQVLLAVLAGFYAVYHGQDGILRISRKIHRMARITANGLGKLGFEIVHEAFYDTVMVRVPGQASRIAARARESRINLRVIDADHLGISIDETTRRRNIRALWNVFSSKGSDKLDIDTLDKETHHTIPDALSRTSPYLTHPVFSLYHAETELLRYLRWLQAKDIALDRAMIPLGSCTMKLNATTEMIPVTWRNFAAMHPFAPLDQAQGYQQLFEELEDMLCEITGFKAVSLQPNAGSQGEFSGLAVIRRYHEANGQGHRNICLIPSSSHGTNPASANMAGMKVVVVASDENGNVNVDDLKEKAQLHNDNLAALMITYPSTHGVFEKPIVEICKVIHDNGGQVYLDGANMNALVGLAKPGEFGADVMHLNLHKTFAIPHGGGGPGVGPIGCQTHLAPFLPNHAIVEGVNPAEGEDGTIGAVAAAPWGSASILPISWAYISMMGPQGMKYATEVAILNANYIAKRLAPYYPVLYSGENGFVAHECILDLSPIKESCGITNEDVAKRLVDYGFHAPTMSFPVVDTLMIEPTESEAKRELDRFCDAMIQIRKEIQDIEDGTAHAQNNLLHNAPHTHHLLMETPWSYPYTKQDAYFPLPTIREDKYWPPVGRIDNVHGDRQLVCSCPPMEAYDEAAE